jgi:hypothetical protein
MYYNGTRCGEWELMVMVILSCGISLSLGACIGFIGAGLCAAASDKTRRRLNSEAMLIGTPPESSEATSASGLFFEDGKSLAGCKQQRGKNDARYATAE